VPGRKGVLTEISNIHDLRWVTRTYRHGMLSMEPMKPRELLTITSPNKGWVVNKLDELSREWERWLETVRHLPDSPDYNPQTCKEAIKDGFAIRQLHHVLRDKTLVFIGNHFSGYEFLFENWPSFPHEANTVRLANIVPDWIRRLHTLSQSIEYARVTDGFWREKGKQLADAIVKAPDKAAEIAAAFLKNPMA